MSEGMALGHALLLCFVKEGRELGFPLGAGGKARRMERIVREKGKGVP